jgi:mutual gliding-motility protein MglA
MAFVNAADRVLYLKVVYFGPGLAGKSTTLKAIHGALPPSARSEIEWRREPFRLLGFNVWPLSLGRVAGVERSCFSLISLTGLEPRANLAAPFPDSGPREWILRHADAIVFVADAQEDRLETNVETQEHLRRLLAAQGRSEVPTVLQYNKVDLPNAVAVEKLDAALNPGALPRFESVAASSQGVMAPFKKACALALAAVPSDLPGR